MPFPFSIWSKQKRAKSLKIVFMVASILVALLAGIVFFPYQWYFQRTFVAPVFPTQNVPTQRPVDIYWNEWDVPYIHAQTDADLAFAMGMVHAQLRYPQLAIMRIIAKGQLAQHFGPKARAIDYTIASFRLDLAASQMLSTIQPKTHRWLEQYRQGINFWLKANPEPAAELALLDAHLTPWSLEDVAQLIRMGSMDVHGLYLIQFLNLIKEDPDWQKLWDLYLDMAHTSSPSYEAVDPAMQLPYSWTKSGSNSFVVGKQKSTHHAALMANDPHIGIFIPSVWMLIGVQSPSFHAVGMSIPGVPALVLGRNSSISWGGTNMYGASTYFFEIDPMQTPMETSQTFIQARFWRGQWAHLRQSPYGPILSDAPLIHSMHDLAMHWEGHKPSDEISTFLQVMQADNFKEFYQAFDTYAVSAMNYLYADRQGNIAQIMAYRQPQMSTKDKKPFYQSTQHPLQSKKPTELPYRYNPPDHILVSTNNRPTVLSQEAGWFFSGPARHQRITDLLQSKKRLTLSDLSEIQRDTMDQDSLAWIQWLAQQNAIPKDHRQGQAMLEWKGHYDQKLQAPYLFEMFFAPVAKAILAQLLTNDAAQKTMLRSNHIKRWALAKFQTLPIDQQQTIIQTGLDAIESLPVKTWGDYHQLQMQHVFGYLPWVGNVFQFEKVPTSGGMQTVYKRAYNPKNGQVTYGANARQLSDLSSPDENYFLIYGGQSGYAFDRNNFNQVPLWQQKKYIHFPLKLETIQKTFRRKQTLVPGY
jgi:penicillin amidase